MEKADIKAHVEVLKPLIDSLASGTDAVAKVNTYVSIRTLLADLDEAAEDGGYPAEAIGKVLVEIEVNCQALAGLLPSGKQQDNQHLFLAQTNLSKLSAASAFALNEK